jgi:hypothetical protein
VRAAFAGSYSDAKKTIIPMLSMTISMYSAITLMMNWYEAIMALSPFWMNQIAAIFFRA